MTLAYLLEHFGVAIAAITGALAARGKRVDLFGVTVQSLATAFGGGTVRDLVLGVPHIFWVEDTAYVYTALGAAVFTFFVVRYADFPTAVLLVADAFVLALFTIVGLKKAELFNDSALIAVIMGVVTGVAGGMLRDLLLGEIPLVFRPETCLYATAAFLGSVAYVALARWGVPAPVNTLVSTGVVLAMRLAGIRWRISLPVFVTRDTPPPRAAGKGSAW